MENDKDTRQAVDPADAEPVSSTQGGGAAHVDHGAPRKSESGESGESAATVQPNRGETPDTARTGGETTTPEGAEMPEHPDQASENLDQDNEDEVPETPRQPTYVENLERRLVEAQDQLREYIQAFKKVKEEQVEFRERLQREAEKDLARLRGKVVSELFEVADNLDRSIAGAEAHWDADAFLSGIKMVRSQFLEKLQGLGLEVIAPAGEKFDPNEAEAIALVPTTDPERDDTVIDVYARGYRMDGRVIRPAKVSVAKLAEDA